MTRFMWRGIAIDGSSHSGIDEAQNKEHLQELLRARQVALLSYSCASNWNIFYFIDAYDKVQLALVFEQLGALLGVGIPLSQAIVVAEGAAQSRGLRKAFAGLKSSIVRGISLAQAMELFPDIFDQHMIALIATGEQTGKLDEICLFLAAYLRSLGDLEKRLKQSAFVPLLTLGFAVMIVWSILVFVIPRFAQFFATFSAPLPLPTRCVLWLSQAATITNVSVFLLVMFSLVLGIKATAKQDWFKRITGVIVLRVPMIKNVLITSSVVHFLTMMILFLKSGFSLKNAIDVMQQVPQSYAFKRALQAVSLGLNEGKALHDAMATASPLFFPQRLNAMVAVGDQGGDLVAVLERCLVLYKQDLDRTFALIEAVFYPVLMAIIGAIIALLMISVYMPIFSLSHVLHY